MHGFAGGEKAARFSPAFRSSYTRGVRITKPFLSNEVAIASYENFCLLRRSNFACPPPTMTLIPATPKSFSDDLSTDKRQTQPGTNTTMNKDTYDQAVSADDELAVLGYHATLRRSRSTWNVAFMAFVLASVPYSLSTTLYFPLIGGGPVAVVWGWVAVCVVMLCVAVSLGEITSVYPTAGGVYYQTFVLSPAWCRRITAWICGWAYVLGTITITLSVNFGTTLFWVGCVNIFTDDQGTGVFEAERYQIYLIFLGITCVCNIIASAGNKWLLLLDVCDSPSTNAADTISDAKTQTAAIFWSFAAVIALTICVLTIAKHGRHDAEYVFTSLETSSGWTAGWSFCIGLLHAAYATSATGMIIS